MHWSRSLLFFFVFTSTQVFSQSLRITRLLLTKNWTIRYPGLKATSTQVPQMFPYANKKKSFEYRTQIKADQKLMSKKHVVLVFDGLDTGAKVFINDTLLKRSHDMLFQFRSEIKDKMKPGVNVLRIVFNRPADSAASPLFFSWGIWKPVYLETWDHLRIYGLQVWQQTLTREKALLRADVQVESSDSAVASFVVKIPDSKPRFLKTSLILKKGINTFSIPITITEPQKWWPNGLGRPFLYAIQVLLRSKAGLEDSAQQVIGLRTVEMVATNDNTGPALYFRVNGVPVFVKGSYFDPKKISANPAATMGYRSLIGQAFDANMNMVRVGGGGDYLDKGFYDDADRKGILIWQDLMLLKGVEKVDSQQYKQVLLEATHQIKRLRGHACMALWCGNDEVKMGEMPKSASDLATYRRLFYADLPKLIATTDSGRSYMPVSPVAKTDEQVFTYCDSNVQKMGEEKMGRFYSKFGALSTGKKTKYLNEVTSSGFIKSSIETFRRNRPSCMGVLYWNPFESFVGWGAAKFALAEAFAPFLITPFESKGKLYINVVSDQLVEINASLKLELMTLEGSPIFSKKFDVLIYPNTSHVYTYLDMNEVVNGLNKRGIFLRTTLTKDGDEVAKNVYYFVPANELQLDKPEIHYRIKTAGKYVWMILSTDKLVKSMYLNTTGVACAFSDNYFDLVPGESKVVLLRPERPTNLTKSLTITSMNSTMP